MCFSSGSSSKYPYKCSEERSIFKNLQLKDPKLQLQGVPIQKSQLEVNTFSDLF